MSVVRASMGGSARRVGRRYEPTLGMPIYAVVTLFMAIGAINSQNNLLFWAFGVALAVMAISGFVSGPALSGLELERFVTPACRAGAATSVRYRLRQRARLSPMFAIEIEEVSADLGKDRVACSVAHVGSRATVHGTAVWTPSRRGVVRLERIEVSSSFPFGLMRKVVVFEQAAVVRVGPAEVAVRGDAVARRPSSPRVTEKTTPRAGVGQEFFGLRDYVPGDTPRLIAWRATARTGTLVTKQTSSDAAPRLAIVLQAPSGLAAEEAYLWERAVALVYEAATRAGATGWRVVVRLPGQGAERRLGQGGAGRRGLLLDLAELPRLADSVEPASAGEARGVDAEAVLVVTPRDGGRRLPGGATVLRADEPDAWLAPRAVLEASLRPPGPDVDRASWWRRLAGVLS